MSIVNYVRKIGRDEKGRWLYRNYHAICCDGCGETVELVTRHFERALVELEMRRWFTVPYDYECPVDIEDLNSSIGYEHFCSEECLDPPEWG